MSDRAAELRKELLRRELAKRQGGQPSVGEDVLKAGGSGLARGAADLVGLPGTVGNAMRQGGQWLLGKGYEYATGHQPAPDSFFGHNEEMDKKLSIFDASGDTMRKGLSDATGGATDYQPQTTPGEYARTLGEFAPGMLLTPGGLAAKGAQAAIPALASEGIGQVSKGSPLEPYLRVMAALGAGVATGVAIPSRLPKVPSAAEIKAAGGDLYEQGKPLLKNVEVTPQGYQKVLQGIKQPVEDELIPEVHGSLQSFVRRNEAGAPVPALPSGTQKISGPTPVANALQQPQAANPKSLWDVENMRKGLNAIGRSSTTNPALGEASGKMKRGLDDIVGALKPGADIVAKGVGDADKGMEIIGQARQTWRTGIKAELVDNAMKQAENAASGYENGLRVEFRKLLKGKNASQWSDEEKQALQMVATGSFKQNALRWMGGFGFPTDGGRNFLGATIGMLGGHALGGVPGSMALNGAGTAARVLASREGLNNAQIAEALIKSGSGGRDLYSAAVGSQKEAQKMALARALLRASTASQTSGSGRQ